MGIFDRMGRVIRSNFNALADAIDDPRKSTEQTLSDMRDQVKAAREEVVRSVAAEKQLRRKVEELDDEADKWATRAELAVRHGDDELARSALEQKARVTRERDRAEALRAEQRQNALEMKAELERMEAKVTELTAKKSTLVAQAEKARVGAEGGTAGVGGGAFDEFRRMEAQIEGVESAVAAQREVEDALRGPGGMTPAEVEAKFRRLEAGVAEGGEASGEIDAQLAALKKKVRIET